MNLDSLQFDEVHGNIKVHFGVVTGLVENTRKYVETHVSGSGGGGSDGNTSSISISSSSTVNHEVWIRPEQGPEISYDFTDMNIPLREGQYISVISASDSNKKRSYNLCVVNHNAETTSLISDAATTCKGLGLIKISNNISLLVILLWAVVVFLVTNSTILCIIGIAPLVYYYVKHIHPKNHAAINRFNDHLEKIVKDVGGVVQSN